MEYLLENRDHAVSVREIDLHMKAENYPVNLTTIYRSLDKLDVSVCGQEAPVRGASALKVHGMRRGFSSGLRLYGRDILAYPGASRLFPSV